MFAKTTYRQPFLILILVLVVGFVLNISWGSVDIPFEETIKVLFGRPTTTESWQYIIWNYRVPKGLTAILVGSGLALSGLLMQTLFRNPLAGPFVLGISSGASLGTAVLIMGASFFAGLAAPTILAEVSITLAASAGSFLVLFVVMSVAARVRDTMALLIIGLMFGSITTAIVSVLSYFSDAERLQQFVFWSFGSVGDLSWYQLLLLAIMVCLGVVLSVISIKVLNALLLGESYAKSMGIDMNRSRFLLIAATGLLAGSITAFAGPIAFVGLAVPHLARLVFHTANHRILIPAVLVCGAILMLFCDLLAQLPGSTKVLPINAVTSLFGAPVVIWLLVKKRKMIF